MPDNEYSAGMHRGAAIATELTNMGEKCGAKPCCVGGGKAIAAAILAEADTEPTDPTVVVTCQCCGQIVKTT